MRLAIAAAALTGLCGSAVAGVTTFIVHLDGFQEVNAMGVPGQGDLDGSGIATLMIDDSFSPPRIDWDIIVNGISFPIIGAHIHSGNAGSNGPVVVDFNSQLSGAGVADADLVNVLANPAGFYVNIHNNDFPAGAIRGQIPAPGVAAVLGPAGLLALRRRR